MHVTDLKTAHRRLDVIEATVKTHQDELAIIRASLENNTTLTQEVATNTAELVTLFKGTKAVYRVFIGVATFVGMIVGAYIYLKEHLSI